MHVMEQSPNGLQGILSPASEFTTHELEKRLFMRRDVPKQLVQFAAGTVEILRLPELRDEAFEFVPEAAHQIAPIHGRETQRIGRALKGTLVRLRDGDFRSVEERLNSFLRLPFQLCEHQPFLPLSSVGGRASEGSEQSFSVQLALVTTK
ncbi:MAG: hypothetical protein E6J79_17965 [Deltaproteobacteria bacterium]|nr:MAG: hypothetical protein E6J79_17965 [Deltaproteobacteria bacterium]